MTTSSIPPNSADPAFIAVIDVSEDLSWRALTELSREGIAAYAEPLPETEAESQHDTEDDAGPGDIHVHDEPHEETHRAPLQRIYVDRTRIPAARAIIASRIPQAGSGFLHRMDPSPRELTPEEVDAQWARLVSDWHPATDSTGSGLSGRLIRRFDDASDRTAAPSSPLGPRDYSVDEELLDDGFVPPEPPPIPRPRHTIDRIAWAGTLGGPALLVANHVLGWGSWIGGAGVAAFMGGFILLVARMRNDRDPDDPGAVV